MANDYKLRPLLIFNGSYKNDPSLDRLGVNNTAEVIKKAFFYAPGLNIGNDCLFLQNSDYADACNKICVFLSSLDSDKDIPLIYFCGHGFPDHQNKTVYLAFSDTTVQTANNLGYDAKNFIRILQTNGQKRYILILDCCHSGFANALGVNNSVGMELSSYLTEGYVHIYSARAFETCCQIKIDDQYQIPFSFSLANILSKLDVAQNFSIADLYKKVKDNVAEITKNTEYSATCDMHHNGDFAAKKIFKFFSQEQTENEGTTSEFSDSFATEKLKMERLKILLVKTSIEYPIKYDDFGIPLGLWLLKSELSTAGHNFEIDIYDERLELHKCGNDNKKRKKVLDNFEPIVQKYDVVGISISTAEVFPAIKKFRIAKKYDKLTFAGGIFTSSNEAYLLKSGCIDYVIPGVATRPVCDLLAKMCIEKEKGRLVNSQFLTIPNIASKDADSFDSPWCPAQLPTMRLSLWKEIIDIYGDYINGKVDVYSARGCGKNCSFCSVNRESQLVVYQKNYKKVIDEINYLKKLGITYFSFKDENLLTDVNSMRKMFNAVKGDGIKFKIRVRYDEMQKSDVTLSELQNFGVAEIQYGIESHDFYIRQRVNKGDYYESCDLVTFITSHATYNIIANCSFILGIEDETTIYYDSLLNFITVLYDKSNDPKPKIYINFLTPHPHNSNDTSLNFSLPNYLIITDDLDYFTHKYPVCFAKSANYAIKDKMLKTYDAIVNYTCSQLYNPLTTNIPKSLRDRLLSGNKITPRKNNYGDLEE